MIRSHIICVSIALLFTCTAAAAQNTTAPASRAEYAGLMGGAVRAATALTAATKDDDKLGKDVDALVRDRNAHDAARCVIPAGNPTYCDAYNAAADALDRRRDALRLRVPTVAQKLGIAKSNFGMSMAKFRIVSILQGYEEWRKRVIECSELNGAIAAETCLKLEWERLP